MLFKIDVKEKKEHWSEKTHLLCKGKYHCMADLLLDWFGLSCFVELRLLTDLLVWIKLFC